jgi:predicted amidohydrolase YtcJ
MDADRENSVDVVYTDGEIIIDANGPPAQAVFIRAGRIAVVGSNEDVLAAAGPGVSCSSLNGATVIPGLIDTHPHLLHFAAFKGSLLDISDAKNHGEIVEAIRRKAEQTPHGSWIMTSPVGESHWFHRRSYRDLEEGNLPDRRILDLASVDHPIMIHALAPKDPNVCAFNTAALKILGIGRSTPDRVNDVWIEKDDEGHPTGILRGSVTNYYNNDPFFVSLLNKMPPLIQPDVVPAALAQAMKDYNALGITTIYEGHAMEFPHIGAYQAFRAQNLLSVRVQTCPELQPGAFPADPKKTIAEINSTLEKALSLREVQDDWLRIEGITACTYGPCYTGCSLVKDGYLSPSGEVTTGKRSISEDNLRAAFEFCAKRGLRLNLCSVSPDEHDDHFAMAVEVMEKYGLKQTGWLLQHGMIIRPDQIKRLVELGFDMTVSTAFTFGEAEIYEKRIGSSVLENVNPFRLLLDAGLNVAASMDWGPTNPFEQMQLAITHRMYPSGRSNAGPAQVVNRAEAYEMWTRHGAKVLGWHDIGSISPGNHADLAILDRNPITCGLDALPSTRVLRTLIGGRVVYDNGDLPAASQV